MYDGRRGPAPNSTCGGVADVDQLKRDLEQMGAETRQSIDKLRADMRERHKEVCESLDKQQAALKMHDEAIGDLRESVGELRESVGELHETVETLKVNVNNLETSVGKLETSVDGLTRSSAAQDVALQDTRRSLIRQNHTLDQGLAAVTDDLDRHRRSVGTAVYGYVDDVNTLKTEMRGLSERVDALERRTPPAA